MERQEIFDKIESIFEKCQQRNKGFNESELDIKETITDYIFKNLALSDVGSSLLDIQLVDWEHTCGDGCCYTYGQDIFLNGEKLDEQNAEDSRNALTAVLTKLGYKFEINY